MSRSERSACPDPDAARHPYRARATRRVPGARITLGPGIPPRAHLRGPSVLDRARAELGYEPRYTLESGMDDWLAWLKTPVPTAG